MYNIDMKFIKEKIQLEKNIENLIPENSIFLDIETTGFSRVYNQIYLIGLLGKIKDEFVFYQFLTEDSSEEKNIILESGKIINQFENIITFNGDSFDLGFIKSKGKKNNIKTNFLDKNSIDLYKIVKNKGFFLELENKRLKTLERYLGIFREDLYSGGELIEFYREYEKGEKSHEGILLLHNKEDIINMPPLFRLFDVIKEKNTVSLGGYDFLLDNIIVNKYKLKISGSCDIKTGYFDEGSLRKLKIKENKFQFEKDILEGNYSKNIKCNYIETSEHIPNRYKIKTPEGIYLLKQDKNILYKNVKELFIKDLNEIFKI